MVSLACWCLLVRPFHPLPTVLFCRYFSPPSKTLAKNLMFRRNHPHLGPSRVYSPPPLQRPLQRSLFLTSISPIYGSICLQGRCIAHSPAIARSPGKQTLPLPHIPDIHLQLSCSPCLFDPPPPSRRFDRGALRDNGSAGVSHCCFLMAPLF